MVILLLISYNLRMTIRKWNINIYKKPNGSEPIVEFLDSLNPKQRVKVLRSIQMLRDVGMSLPMPHKKYLGDGIYELRVQLSSNIFRVLFIHVEGNEIVLLHGFQKKTQATPSKEIDRAKRYRADYIKQAR